jgi:cellulose synthase/poly-beta-1,6-N-acetylglucosamine synthase-like glycosyltransferase
VANEARASVSPQMSATDWILTLLALPVTAASSYLGLLALLARRQSPPPAVAPWLCFDVIVPAHNEESEIGATVASLRAVDYPRDRYRVFVVADNCSDRTASRARAAGAEVLVRADSSNRGKGYALAFGFERSLRDAFADMVVVVDADTLVSPNLLRAFAARFAAGARAVQADYGPRNPRASWRTRVMTIALAAFHGVRSVARERLGLSCGLRGNGMGFARALLQQHPPRAFSIVEDLEYGLQLGYAGVRVTYVDEAHVQGHMAVSERDSRSQRRRWERGRRALVRANVLPLLRGAWRRRDPLLADLAFDLLVPPIGQIALWTALGLMLSLAAQRFFDLRVTVAPWLCGISALGLILHVAQGWRFAGSGLRGLVDLLWAPVYVVWKLTLRFADRGHAPKEWVRTRREIRS